MCEFCGEGGQDLLVWECVGCWWWCDTATLKTGATAQIPSHILFLTHLFCADSLLSDFQENVTGSMRICIQKQWCILRIYDDIWSCVSLPPHPSIHPAFPSPTSIGDTWCPHLLHASLVQHQLMLVDQNIYSLMSRNPEHHGRALIREWSFLLYN